MIKKTASDKIIWFITFLTVLSSTLFLITAISLKKSSAEIVDLETSKEQLSSENRQLVEGYKSKISKLKTENLLTGQELETLESQVSGLEDQLLNLNLELEKYQVVEDEKYPFAVPSTGILPNFASGYGENMRGMQHWAVDIWTTTENYGKIANHKGNPVYSACDGKVVSFDNANGAVTIACDEIPENYDVPAHKDVMTYYGHMGNGETKELFINVSMGQHVQKGQLIGYQGDLSKFFPEMRNVHLHFQVWSIKMQPLDTNSGGPHNPCSYIGGNCNTPGEEFTAESL